MEVLNHLVTASKCYLELDTLPLITASLISVFIFHRSGAYSDLSILVDAIITILLVYTNPGSVSLWSVMIARRD